MKRYILPMIAMCVIILPVYILAATWQIDPDHSSFQFKVRHMTVSNVKGDFNKARGVVTIDDNDVNNLKVEVTIDAGLGQYRPRKTG